jgi:hypothetical protein
MGFKKTHSTGKGRSARLETLAGVDLCACGTNNSLPCAGSCRQTHLVGNGRFVRCNEMYQVELPWKRKDNRPRPRFGGSASRDEVRR